MGWIQTAHEWILGATPLGSVANIIGASYSVVEPALNAQRKNAVANATAQATIDAYKEATRGALEYLTPEQRASLLVNNLPNPNQTGGFEAGTQNLLNIALVGGGIYLLSQFMR